MPAHTQSRGDEPSMYLQRPSTGKSQDVRHILVRTFRDVFTRDAIGPDTVKNLSVSKGGDDPYHERYVEALQKVFSERQRRMEEVAMLERHIMQAQARAMSADERKLNRAMNTCDNYPDLGLPPVDTSFKRCLDTEMLKKYNLLTPEDYSTEEAPPVPPPSAEKIPSYARETLTSRQHTKDDLFVPTAPESPQPLTARSKSDIGSLVSEDRLTWPEDKTRPGPPRNDAWKQQMGEDRRELERTELDRLNAKVNYHRNPRFVPPSAPAGGRTLIKSHKVKAKEVGIQPKADDALLAPEPSQVFLLSPPSVIFTDYKVGQVYELTLTLKNVSACIRQCRALPASTQYFSIGLGQFPGEHGLVAPGMSCHYAVRFNPDSLRDFYDEIRIQTQSNDPIIVPLMGRRPPPKLSIPPVLDVGYCLVGGCHVTQFLIRNQGGPGRFCIMPSSAWPTTSFKSVVRNGAVAIPPFDVRPSLLDIGHNQTGIMEVVFQPPALKSYSVDMCMVCDNCHVRHFTIKGESERAGVELISVERGLSEALPGELTDATAQHLLKFDQLNPFTYTDRTAVIRNTTNVSLPFQWMMYKPQFDSPGAESPNKKYDRVPDVDSVFSVHPPTGVLPPAETMEFKITYAPPVVDKFHSTLHMLLNMVPASLEPIPTSKGTSSASSSDNKDKDGAKTGDDGAKDDDDNISEIMVQHGDAPPFGDVTAVEIEVKGESSPLCVVLHPYSIHVPGKNLVGTSLKKLVTMANHSHSTITFQWEPYTEKYLLEVEPPFGELDPGMAMDMELCITGPEPGKIDHTLYCHVMNLEEPLHLQVQAEYKGPEVSVDEPDLNFGLVRLGQTVRKTITINNMAQIITPWSVQDSPAIPDDLEDEMGFSEFQFEPSSGELRPLESQVITVTFNPSSRNSIKRVIEVLVEDGTDCNIACYAEVQSPAACLMQCEITIPTVYKGVPVMAIAKLLNQTLMPTTFEWGKVYGEDSKDCSLELDPMISTLAPREEKPITISFTASREGDFSDLKIPCKVEGIDQPLIMALFCDVKGLAVHYDVSKDGREPLKLDTTALDFGEVELNTSPKLYLHLENKTAISAQYTFSLESFFSKPPSPPDEKKEGAARRAISTRRLMLGKTPNLADPLAKTASKAQADLNAAMLSQGNGSAFVPQPASGVLSPFGEEVIEVTAFSDMWGDYKDNITCKVGDLEETKIPVSMTVTGCPLAFQMTSGLPDLRPVVRFGTHVAGTQACNRVMRVKNNSPYDVRVDWQVFNVKEGDGKLMDMVVCYGKPFPLLDDDGNEIPPPTEAPKPKKIVPMPVIREPTDYIPNSADTSQNVSREISHATFPKGNTDPDIVPIDADSGNRRPKVVSVFCREHHGQLAPAPYSIRPGQLVVPAKGHASVSVTFTPHATHEVTEDTDCVGYILGYLSLDTDKAKGDSGKVSRPQAYLASQIRLDMTAHLKPALLTIECGDEEGMRYRSAMSSLLKDDGQLQAESLKVATVMLSNLTLTPLTFRLVTKKPFMLVELDPHSTREGTTRSQSTEMHSLRPRHNLVVKVAFQTTSGLLSEIADEYMNGEEVGEAGRKIEIKKNLVVEFNNGGEQLVPLHATLTVPQFELSKESLDFGTCLVGQTRELQFLITNTTSSHTLWSVSQETRSDTCAMDTFSIKPTSGQLEAHITHISDSKSLLKVYFTAKHAEDYDAVFAFHGILGETPRRLYVRAQGSYDGKHEALLNV